MARLDTIEGIGLRFAERFHAMGITSVEALLEAGRTPEQRKLLAQQIGVTANRMTGWVNRADLARVKGIGSEYADLLEAAGVHTVPELAKHQADELHAALKTINRVKRLVRRVPSLNRLETWITLAQTLPAVVVK